MATEAPLLEGDFATSPTETTLSHHSLEGVHDPNRASLNGNTRAQTRPTPTAPPANPRSCVTCRKRKVKCDKKLPCSNCSKAAIECIFPGPGRAPRRSRKPQDTELLTRLRTLEGVVQSLGRRGDEGHERLFNSICTTNGDGKASKENGQSKRANPENVSMIGTFDPKNQNIQGGKSDDMIKEFGRLVVDEGKSRYVSNRFWTSLSEEVAEMRDILDDTTDEDENYPSPGGSSSSASTNHQSYLFSFRSSALSLRRFHPSPREIPVYWSIFKSNVDPVSKLFHIPTMETFILNSARDLDHISKSQEALMFSVYFASVTTLSANDCLVTLGIEKQSAIENYRFATEQAFARCGFLSTQELIVLQALLLFLVCVRRTDDSRYVWTMTGLLIRLAQALGAHRDGEIFNLSPFETELRRRLWWHIVTLDVRASEDHGCDPSIVEQSFDTKFPLNINDADINPSVTQTPKEHEGATEMTFDLIRYSVVTTLRRLSYAPPGPGPCRLRAANLSLEDKEKMIEDLHQHLEQKYLKHCNTETNPLHWVAATVARLIMAKMWLVVHHSLQRSDANTALSKETENRLFHTSLEVIEFARLLETEKTTQKWGWLFRTYIQWHALAFVLSQLCTRTLGLDVNRAWVIIDGVFEDWGGVVSGTQRGMLWKPLRKLMAKARAERAKALQREAMFPLDGSIGPVTNLNTLLDPSMNTPSPELPMISPNSDDAVSGLNNSDGIEAFATGLPSFDPLLGNPLSLDEQFKQEDMTNDIDGWGSDPSLFVQDPPMMLDINNMNFPMASGDMVKDYDPNHIRLDGSNAKAMAFCPEGMTSWF